MGMNIIKEEKTGLWFTDEDGNVVPWDGKMIAPKEAVYAHSCYPLEIREEVYKIRKDGHYGKMDKVCEFTTNIGREYGRLIVAMVNSGDYDLYDAISVCARACERCINVLWNKYLPGEDGYEEFSDEWKKANTVCDFCRDYNE